MIWWVVMMVRSICCRGRSFNSDADILHAVEFIIVLIRFAVVLMALFEIYLFFIGMCRIIVVKLKFIPYT